MKNKTKFLIMGCIALTLGGCEVQKEWASVGGSKTDGIVTLGFQRSRLEKPITSDSQGLAVATRTCQNWGYETAIAFDLAETTCTSYSYSEEYGRVCNNYKVLKNYQCQ